MLDQSCLRLFSYNNIFVKSAFLYGSKKPLIIFHGPKLVTKVTKLEILFTVVKDWDIYIQYSSINNPGI